MKKIMYALLAALLLVGCGTNDKKDNDAGNHEVPHEETKQQMSEEDQTKYKNQAQKLSKTLAESSLMYDDYTNYKAGQKLPVDFMSYLYLVAAQYPDEASHIYNQVSSMSDDQMFFLVQENDATKIANEVLGSSECLKDLAHIYDEASGYYRFPSQSGVPHKYDVSDEETIIEHDEVRTTLKIAELNMGQDPSEIKSKKVFMKYKVLEDNGNKFLRLIEIGDAK